MTQQHPPALYMLFATEMWERFSFYTMQALLVLYATAAIHQGGLGLDTKSALALFGLYGAAVYILPILGACIADRWIGLQTAVVWGGALMAVGHFLMVFETYPTFLAALALLALGSGFFKPCITSILGLLYEKQPELRDSGYSIFYMGVNVGAFLAGIAGGYLQVYYGFSYAFGAAGIGMLIGQSVFMVGRKKYLGEVGFEPSAPSSLSREGLSSFEKRRVGVLIAVYAFVMTFFIAYWQYGGALMLYTETYTNRDFMGFEVPTAWFFSLNPLYVVLCCPIISLAWNRMAKQSEACLDLRKILVGFALSTLSFGILWAGSVGVDLDRGVQSGMGLLIVYYLIITIGEYCIVPVTYSLISKLAPQAYLSRLMGLFLVSIGISSMVASKMGESIADLPPSTVFAQIGWILAGFTLLLLFSFSFLERWGGLRPTAPETRIATTTPSA